MGDYVAINMYNLCQKERKKERKEMHKKKERGEPRCHIDIEKKSKGVKIERNADKNDRRRRLKSHLFSTVISFTRS